MASTTMKVVTACSVCGKTANTRVTTNGLARLPKAWKRGSDQLPVCSGCWSRKYRMLACTIPVAEFLDGTKEEMWELARTAWQAATHAANLTVRTLANADFVRGPDMEKMPPMPEVYLYGALKDVVTVSPATLVAILHDVSGKWREARREILWFGTAAPMRFRYPLPYPFGTGEWKAEYNSGGAPVFHARLGGAWRKFRLRGGTEFRRQLAQFRLIESGIAERVQAAIYPSRDGKRIMCKMVAWFPRQEHSNDGGSMRITTGSDRFLTCVIGDREPWYLNADNVRQWIAEHARNRQRLAEDLKFERRWPKEIREKTLDTLRRRCEKHDGRMKNFLQTRSREVANFAKRQRVATVMYDDTDVSYFPSFPWFQWRELLTRKLDEYGIVLEHVSSAPVPSDTPVPLADTEAETPQ